MEETKQLKIKKDYYTHIESFEFEEWGEIRNYPKYRVSNYGRVKRIAGHYSKGRILQPQLHKQGYLMVGLYNEHGLKMHTIHALVAGSFIPNKHKFSDISHLDNNYQNNCVDNLRWADTSECIRLSGVHNNKCRAIKQIDPKTDKVIQHWLTVRHAHKIGGFTKESIYKVLNGIQKTSGGFKWEYVE